MRHRSLVWLGTWSAIALGASALMPGCGNDVEITPPIPAAGGSAPTGGAGGGGAEGGSGGAEVPSRGEPSEFPTDCVASCQEACARLAECDGASSELYPLDAEQCAERCGMQESGPMWDDLSGTFKCCASQPACADVQHCGGWLAHDAVVASCEKLCECFFSGALAALTAGMVPPEGYRFATDRVFVRLDAPVVRTARASLEAIAGVRVSGRGRRLLVELTSSAPADVLEQIAGTAELLPTLVDAAGRFVAATGTIVLLVDDAAALDAASELAAESQLSAPRATRLTVEGASRASVYFVESADPWRVLESARQLDALPRVRAELDLLRQYRFRYEPDDPRFPDQWHLENSGQGGAVVGADGRVSEAWDLTLGDGQIVIALNDDGVDLNHPDLAGRLEPELNYPDDWETQMAQGQFGWHGTSCAGVAAAAADNSEGGAGVCPGCRLQPHLLGESSGMGFQATDAEIAAGFERMVDAGASVISNSWGYETGDPIYVESSLPLPPLPSVVRASFDYAEANGRGGLGTIVVFAGGNSNDVVDPLTAYETNVAVAAVTDLGIKSYYSAFGPEIDIAAPSNGGLSGIVTTAANAGYTDEFGGTSSACPYVAGVVGLMLSANPALTAAEVRQALGASATKIDPVFGQWDEEGHSPFYGSGLVNAYLAVQLGTGACADPATCPAPSDDCTPSCGTVGACGSCRTEADCADGFVCQALPSLGAALCVAVKGTDPCPAGTVERAGHCLPEADTCGLCGEDESCNGRDDDCDGQTDEDDVCEGSPRCFFDGPGCPSGQLCAGTRCTLQCEVDGDCADGDTCETLKDAYGAVPGPKGCVSSGVSQCQVGCEVLVSSLPDADLQAFVDCMEDGEVSCGAVYGCASSLPINM